MCSFGTMSTWTGATGWMASNASRSWSSYTGCVGTSFRAILQKMHSSLIRFSPSPVCAAVKARPFPRVARGALLPDTVQQCVDVAVVEDLFHVLEMARGFALHPEGSPGAAPVGRVPAGEGAPDRLGVRPRHHENHVVAHVLRDDRDQPPVVELHLPDQLVRRHRPSHSCAASEGGAPFVARRAMDLHGCALPHCAPLLRRLRRTPLLLHRCRPHG